MICANVMGGHCGGYQTFIIVRNYLKNLEKNVQIHDTATADSYPLAVNLKTDRDRMTT